MIISGIELYNFKGFKGKHQLSDLDSGLSARSNILLFGGLNGAGKTTFLEALLLCMYGRNAHKLFPSKGAKHEYYEAYIVALLNNTAKHQATLNETMYVEIDLKDVSISGPIPRDITIRRTWEFQIKNKVFRLKNNEGELSILENGDPIDEYEPTDYQDAITTLMPYDVSQFFLFDGEKIQDFAGDADVEFASSLKDVLGINLYAQLSKDLKEVKSKILSKFNKNKDAKLNIKNHEAKQLELESKNNELRTQIDNRTDEVARLSVESEKIEHETYRITNVSASDRSADELLKMDQQKEKQTLQKDFIDTSKNYLPFILAHEYFDKIIDQLKEEKKYKEWQTLQEKIEPQISDFIQEVFDDAPPEYSLKPNQRRFYEFKIDKNIRKFFLNAPDGDIGEVNLIHNLNSINTNNVITFINTVNQGVVETLSQKSSKLKELNISINKIARAKTRAGEGNEIFANLMKKKGQLDQQIGQLEQQIEDNKFQIQENNAEIKICEREITIWQGKANVSEKEQKQIDYCNRLINTIEEFKKELQAKYTKDLENSILEMWYNLTHKDYLVSKVKVLPELNFSIKLYNSNKTEIDKTKLSAGEKEVYAISLLWALMQVSGKKFPLIIDTPFGRLDSKHRQNLVENYFPKASHQVILLSQDEEIVDEYYDALRPYIAQEYTIFNTEKTSEFKSGYPFTTAQTISL